MPRSDERVLLFHAPEGGPVVTLTLSKVDVFSSDVVWLVTGTPAYTAAGSVVVVRPMMYVALSYDHRLVDGRESVSFLVRVKELLEDPASMIIT